MSKKFLPVEHTLTPRDCILYALGIGIGQRPDSSEDLRFVFEEGLKVFPAMANVISHPSGWARDPELDIDFVKLLHGEQSFSLVKPLRPNKTYVGAYRVTDVIDKGVGKGVMVYVENKLTEKESGDVASVVRATYVLRGDGGCGSTTAVAPVIHAIPERPADSSVSLTTLPQAALIYRLSGDYNPIHASPEIARKAGFERPILHGMCSMGVATRAVLQDCCNDCPERLHSVKVRFSSPVYPGETICTEFWKEDAGVSFRATCVERNVVVLNNGYAEIDA